MLTKQDIEQHEKELRALVREQVGITHVVYAGATLPKMIARFTRTFTERKVTK